MGNFTGTLNSGDNFGSAVASLGDFDGNGVEDVAVGASGSIMRYGYCFLMGTERSYQTRGLAVIPAHWHL